MRFVLLSFLVVGCAGREPPNSSVPAPPSVQPTTEKPTPTTATKGPAKGCQSTPSATEGALCDGQAPCKFEDAKFADIRCVCVDSRPNLGPATPNVQRVLTCMAMTRPDGCPTWASAGLACTTEGQRCVYERMCGTEHLENVTVCTKKVWNLTKPMVPCPNDVHP